MITSNDYLQYDARSLRVKMLNVLVFLNKILAYSQKFWGGNRKF